MTTKAPNNEVTVASDASAFGQTIRVGPHVLIADEPKVMGGDDAGPMPHDFVLAGLGACTSMTVKMYASRKQWPLTGVHVTLNGKHEDGTYIIDRRIRFDGDLTDEQRARLMEIADKCPVHKTLSGTIRIDSQLELPGIRAVRA